MCVLMANYTSYLFACWLLWKEVVSSRTEKIQMENYMFMHLRMVLDYLCVYIHTYIHTHIHLHTYRHSHWMMFTLQARCSVWMFTSLSITLDSYFYYLNNQIPIIFSLIRFPNSNGLSTYRIMLYKEWQGTNFEFGSLAGSASLRLQALKFYNTDYWNLIGFHLCHPIQVPWQRF
jgi:hypothetical protein